MAHRLKGNIRVFCRVRPAMDPGGAGDGPCLRALSRTQLEQGATASMAVELTRNREFDAEVTAELGRVPKGVEVAIPAITPANTTWGRVALVRRKSPRIRVGNILVRST